MNAAEIILLIITIGVGIGLVPYLLVRFQDGIYIKTKWNEMVVIFDAKKSEYRIEEKSFILRNAFKYIYFVINKLDKNFIIDVPSALTKDKVRDDLVFNIKLKLFPDSDLEDIILLQKLTSCCDDWLKETILGHLRHEIALSTYTKLGTNDFMNRALTRIQEGIKGFGYKPIDIQLGYKI